MVIGYPGFDPNESEETTVPVPEQPVDTAEHRLPENITKTEKELTVSFIKKFGIPWKSIVGFLSVLAAQLVTRATVDGVAVIPDTTSGWASLLGGAIGAAVLIYLKGNTYSVPQAEKNLAKAEERERENPAA